MAELTQRQQERISKSSSDRLRSQLVRGGVDEDEVAQMDRGELKIVAAQIEDEKQGGEDARQKPLPDDAEELFRSPEMAASRSQEYEVLKMKLELRKMELEAEKEARQAEAESRNLEAEARKAEADKEARKLEAEASKAEAKARKAETEREIRKAEAERQTRKMELEMEIKRIEVQARIQGGDNESSATGLEGTAAVAGDHSLTGRTKKFGDALRHILPHMSSQHAELPQLFDTVETLFMIYQVPADV